VRTANKLAINFSPMRLGHATANMGPAAARDFSDGKPKPKMRHLCKNMKKAVQNTASRLLAFIGIGGPSLAVTVPNVPEGGTMRIQITTTSPAPHKFILPSFHFTRSRKAHKDVNVYAFCAKYEQFHYY